LGGYSAICLARSLPPDGRLVTLELEPKHAAVAGANLARAGLAERVEVRVGPAVMSLAHLAAEGAEPFDLVFIDADKPSYVAYLQGSLPLARPGTLIIADNVVRQGRVWTRPATTITPRARRFNDQRPPTRGAVVLQTVGSKGATSGHCPSDRTISAAKRIYHDTTHGNGHHRWRPGRSGDGLLLEPTGPREHRAGASGPAGQRLAQRSLELLHAGDTKLGIPPAGG
jgi:hypothetical protein